MLFTGGKWVALVLVWREWGCGVRANGSRKGGFCRFWVLVAYSLGGAEGVERGLECLDGDKYKFGDRISQSR